MYVYNCLLMPGWHTCWMEKKGQCEWRSNFMDCGGGGRSQSHDLGFQNELQRTTGEWSYQPQGRGRSHWDPLHEDWNQADVQDPWAWLLGPQPGLRTGSSKNKTRVLPRPSTNCSHKERALQQNCRLVFASLEAPTRRGVAHSYKNWTSNKTDEPELSCSLFSVPWTLCGTVCLSLVWPDSFYTVFSANKYYNYKKTLAISCISAGNVV